LPVFIVLGIIIAISNTEVIAMKRALVPYEVIEKKIYLIRGKKVMLDRDLADLYGVDNYQLKRQVKRNLDRFPSDFMFIINEKEMSEMVCHFGIPSRSYFGGSKPFAFTEHGILMLSSILNSKRAIYVNIQIMRAFVRLRVLLASHKNFARKLKELEQKVGIHDQNIIEIITAIRQLMEPPEKETKKIGFVK
jgi:hypothetical protein